VQHVVPLGHFFRPHIHGPGLFPLSPLSFYALALEREWVKNTMQLAKNTTGLKKKKGAFSKKRCLFIIP
jgi:hypothetical protein